MKPIIPELQEIPDKKTSIVNWKDFNDSDFEYYDDLDELENFFREDFENDVIDEIDEYFF